MCIKSLIMHSAFFYDETLVFFVGKLGGFFVAAGVAGGLEASVPRGPLLGGTGPWCRFS